MNNKTNLILTRICALLLFCTTCSFTSKALDFAIPVQSITAGDTYSGLNPQVLINGYGLSTFPPTDLENTTYYKEGWDCWHTSGGANSNVYLLVDFGESFPITKLYIWNLNQLSDGSSYKDRDIKDITISYSANSTNGTNGTWQTLGDYVIPQSNGDNLPCKAQKVIDIDASARYVKILAKSSYGSQYWGLGKLVFLKESVGEEETKLLELQAELGAAQKMKFYNYTDGSWQSLATAMINAKIIVDMQSKDIPTLVAATNAIKLAVTDLVEKSNQITEATVSAISFYEAGYEPQKAIDGKFDTRWASSWKSGNQDFWYQIDLKEAKSFNQIMIFGTSQYISRIKETEIFVSDNGTTWTPWREKVWANTHLSAVGDVVSKRYIKLVFPNSDSEGINIDEIMLFNDATAIETQEPTTLRPEDPSWIKPKPETTPSVYQLRKESLKYGMFIHYGINTFVGEEWTDGSLPPATYNPNLETLDPESWVKAAYNGGMNFIILVAKHHEGFALWNTAVGTYNINNTGREGDKRDIVKEVADACKKYGIKLGLYYSSWDRNWDLHNTEENTGLDRIGLCQLYNDFALAQITELMDGRYGEISEFWIDGAWQKPNEEWEFSRMYNLVKTLQPTCQFGINHCVNEMPNTTKGGEEMTFFPSDFRLKDPHFTNKGANADPKVYKYKGNEYYLPFEATICINKSWFWSAGQNAANVLSAPKIKDSYFHMVDQRNTLVVNLSPTKDGVFQDFDINGLYAGARLLDIARGEARNNIPSDECIVEVRYVTDKGYIAFPTKQLYGKAGESYNALPENLTRDGYQLKTTPANVDGTFTTEKIVVEFIYEDTGLSVSTSQKAINTSVNNVFVAGQQLIIVCNESSNVIIYNLSGVKETEFYMSSNSIRNFDVANRQGFYIVKFVGENKNTQTMKVRV